MTVHPIFKPLLDAVGGVSNPVTHDDALRGRLNTRQALEYIRNELREQIDGDSPRDGWVSDLIRVADMALERGDGR